MGWQIFENIVTFVQGMIYFSFLTELLGSRYNGKKKWLFLLGATSLASIGEYLGRVVFQNESISLGALLGMMLIYSLFWLEGSYLSKIGYILLVNVIAALGSVICYFIFASVFEIDPEVFVNIHQTERIIFVFTSLLVFVIAMRVTLGIQKMRKFEWNESGISLVIPVLTIFILFAIQKTFVNDGKEILDIKYLVLIFVGLLISNSIVYFLVGKLSKKREELLRYKMRAENIKEMIRINEESRKIRHDIGNMLLIAIGYLEDEKTEKAKEYLKEIQKQKIEVLKENTYCKNEAVNYILMQKNVECKKKGIKFTSRILTEISGITEVDLSILLGNALDNAIAGTKDEKNPEIELEIKKEEAYLSILVKNKVKGSVLEENPKLLTGKEDKRKHGLGIRSMKTIVSKYNGIIDFYEKDNEFYCHILLG